MLRRELVSLRGEKSQANWGSTLMQVLDVLKRDGEIREENPKTRSRRRGDGHRMKVWLKVRTASTKGT